jgi:hypothetical protein
VLVYEELTNDSEPIKYYGYRDKFMSVNEQTKIPNYALMIYDVSESMFADLIEETEARIQNSSYRTARQI